MPYTAEVSRNNPTCFLFLIDQSRSMSDEISAGDATQQKSTGVADSVNRWMQELSLKCTKSGGVGNYYHVGVVGYGKNVGPAFVGAIAGRDLVPISEIAENPGRIETRTKKIPDGSGGLVDQSIKVPIWFDPIADGGTPMCRAAAEGYRILQDWVAGHSSSYPPIVIHITDGEATDGDPTPRIKGIANLSTTDGNVMLFNIHLSAHPNANPVIFPDSADNLPDAYSRMLFETSSPLTPIMRAIAKEQGIPTTEGSRAFVLNADMVLLVQAIDIGTRPANLTSTDADAVVVEHVAPEPEPVAVVQPEPEPELMPEPEPELMPEPEPVLMPEPEPVLTPEPEPEPENEGHVFFEEPPVDDDPGPEDGDDAMRDAERREEAMVAERAAAREAAAAPTASAPVASAPVASAPTLAVPEFAVPEVTTGAAVAETRPVRLTVQATGKLIEAEIHTDDDGHIVNIFPVIPLDPATEYRLGPEN